MRKLWILSLILFILIASFSSIRAEEGRFNREDSQGNLRLGNDYVVIVVNQDENARGRFAIETTGGAPTREDDKNKPLIYGRPKPWTSYTTVKIDDDNYVFGGSTGRRAGEKASYGEVVTPPTVEDDSIVTVSEIDGVRVEQNLTLVKSSTTGLYDTVQIKYRVKNETDQEKELGLRVMLDTMLGENDGAPFRIGEDAVTEDRMYLQENLPNFYQAFDSISSPKVTSQGTFKGPGVTAPDKVYLADWGGLADGSWDFDFNPDQEFIRKGEHEIDSAIAMVWEPTSLEPGTEKTYVTNYGLGGITIVPGLISVGVTSPAEVTFDRLDRTFPVVAYIENTSDITAREAQVSLDLPDSFTVDNPVKELGDFESGDIDQIIWDVKPTGEEIPEAIEYEVLVEAENTDDNSVQREVSFVGPPKLETRIAPTRDLEVELGRLQPNPFTVQAQIENSGGSILYDPIADLSLPPGLTLAEKEVTRKYLGFIKPGEQVNVNWTVRALAGIEEELPFAVNVEGLNGFSAEEKENINIPALEPLLYLEGTGQSGEAGKYYGVDLQASNLEQVESLEIFLSYDKELLKPVSVYP
ncbi:MAG: hypothetical protein ACOCZ3_02925, partial [Bacillota bacterium]